MLEILRDRGVEFDVIEYLKQPLRRADFERILDAIPDEPGELVRKDKRFGELGLDAAGPGQVVTDDDTSGPNISRLIVTWTSSISIPNVAAASDGKIVPEWSDRPMGMSYRARNSGIRFSLTFSTGHG